MLITYNAERADSPRTVAAGPVKAVSTGRLNMCSIGRELHLLLKCEVGPLYSVHWEHLQHFLKHRKYWCHSAIKISANSTPREI